MTQTSDVGTTAPKSAFQRVMLAVDDSEATLRAAEYAKVLLAGRAKIDATSSCCIDAA